jgi:hypothetical protein
MSDLQWEFIPESQRDQVMLDLDSALDHRLGSGRNGLPEPVAYEWNVEGRCREAEVAEQLAAIRARVSGRSGVTSPAPEGQNRAGMERGSGSEQRRLDEHPGQPGAVVDAADETDS